MKSLRVLALVVVGALGLAGCGDGSVKSPAFTPLLRALGLETNAVVDQDNSDGFFIPLGIGASLDLSALCSTPPGTTGGPVLEGEVVQVCTANGAAFSIEPVQGDAGAASVQDGLLVGTSTGSVTVTAVEDGIESNALTFRIGDAVISEINVTPDNPPPVAVNESIEFTAEGTFSDGTTDDVSVVWTVTDEDGNALPPGTVTFDSSGNTTTVTPQPGSEGQTVIITGTFSMPDGNGGTVVREDSSELTISNETLNSLLRIEPDNESVAPTFSVQFSAIGEYVGGTVSPREGEIPASQVTWSSSDPTIASIDANTGLATGQPPGGDQVTITGALRTPPAPGGVNTPPGENRSDTATLIVTNEVCTSPLLSAQGATAGFVTDGLCIGCNVADAGNVIDASDATFATMSAPIGLLNGTVTLNVDASNAATPFASGSNAGLIVAKPAGLLSAELLSSLTVCTRLDGATTTNCGTPDAETLNVTLLGAIGGQDAALLSFPATAAFDGLALTFDIGVLSLLPTVNVFQACGVSTP